MHHHPTKFVLGHQSGVQKIILNLAKPPPLAHPALNWGRVRQGDLKALQEGQQNSPPFLIDGDQWAMAHLYSLFFKA